MRIAIFHNFMDNIGGAEIVALSLVRELEADLYTTNIDLDKIKKMGYADVATRIYSIGRIPKQAPFRQQLAFWKFRRLNLAGRYDFFIIAGDWAMSAAVNHHPNLWYVHSPLNELWEFKDFIKKDLLNFWKKPIYDIWVLFNRKLSLNYARNVDCWVANSLNTKQRIKKFYQQEAEIIYPPVETTKYYCAPSQDYWLSVNRLAAHKRPEMQIEAFKNLPHEKLIMVASYEEGVVQFEKCKKMVDSLKTSNITIKHWVDDQELKELYANCKGFITTAQNEDFGMTVVEAMASGKIVIAPHEGGYPESIINGKTGLLIADINSTKLEEAILSVKSNLEINPLYYQKSCLTRGTDFDTLIFVNKIKELIWLRPALPVKATIDPASICNLQCPLCPTGTGTIRLKQTMMNFTDFKSYLDKLHFIKSLSLYNWGESFLNQEIFEIIRYAKSKKIVIDIDSNFSLNFSNGDLLNIIECGLDYLQISLDGASPATYNKYRKGGDFNLVYDNLKRLKAIQKNLNALTPKVVWKFIVNKYNQSEIEIARKMAKELDIEIQFEKMGLADDIVDIEVTPDITIFEKINYWLSDNREYIRNSYTTLNNQMITDKEMRCPMLFSQVILHADGHILPCCFAANSSSFMGNLKEQTIEEIWYSDQYKYARSLFFPVMGIKRVPVVCENCNIFKKDH